MGYTPSFTGTFYQSRATQGGSGQLTLRLNECVSSHLTIPSRIDDYAIQDFDFQAFPLTYYYDFASFNDYREYLCSPH